MLKLLESEVMPFKKVAALVLTMQLLVSANSCKVELSSAEESEYMVFLDSNAGSKIRAINYSNIGDFLGIIAVVDPKQVLSERKDCQKALLASMGVKLKINDSSNEILWVLKNDGKNENSSEWLDNYDSLFHPYCSFITNNKDSTYGEILKYANLTTANKSEFDECIVCFYKQNNIRAEGDMEVLNLAGQKIIGTRHGLILRRGSQYKWLYLSDHKEKLRWATIDKVEEKSGNIWLYVDESRDPDMGLVIRKFDILKN